MRDKFRQGCRMRIDVSLELHPHNRNGEAAFMHANRLSADYIGIARTFTSHANVRLACDEILCSCFGKYTKTSLIYDYRTDSNLMKYIRTHNR